MCGNCDIVDKALMTIDHQDYEKFLAEFNLTENVVRSISENMTDHIDLDMSDCKAKLGRSLIEGEGMFAASNIDSGERIAPTRSYGKRTLFGRKVNHSADPNCMCAEDSDGNAFIYASRDIEAGEELTLNYRESVRLNTGLMLALKERSNRVVIESMMVLARGISLASQVSIDDLFELENAIIGSDFSVGDSALNSLTRHIFEDGVYVRELTIPATMCLTGAIHKTRHVSILAKGDISILTVDGVKRIKAPLVIHTQPGAKRIGFAHSETVWIDVFPNPTNEKDTDKLWSFFYHNINPKKL